MPLHDWNDPATWDNAYEVRRLSTGAIDAHYERDSSLYSAAMGKAAKIVAALNLQPAHKVGIIGCGYGWIANNIALIAGCTVAAVDTSTYIQSGKLANADIEIINADVSSNNGRNQVKQALGITGNNKADFIITEDVITDLTDAECQQLSTFLHNLSDNVVHWTSVLQPEKIASGHQDPSYNWKSIADWKALLPNDLFIVVSTAVLA